MAKASARVCLFCSWSGCVWARERAREWMNREMAMEKGSGERERDEELTIKRQNRYYERNWRKKKVRNTEKNAMLLRCDFVAYVLTPQWLSDSRLHYYYDSNPSEIARRGERERRIWTKARTTNRRTKRNIINLLNYIILWILTNENTQFFNLS